MSCVVGAPLFLGYATDCPQNLNHINGIRNHILNRKKFVELNFLSNHSSHTSQMYVSFTKALCLYFCSSLDLLYFLIYIIKNVKFYSKISFSHPGKIRY